MCVCVSVCVCVQHTQEYKNRGIFVTKNLTRQSCFCYHTLLASSTGHVQFAAPGPSFSPRTWNWNIASSCLPQPQSCLHHNAQESGCPEACRRAGRVWISSNDTHFVAQLTPKDWPCMHACAWSRSFGVNYLTFSQQSAQKVVRYLFSCVLNSVAIAIAIAISVPGCITSCHFRVNPSVPYCSVAYILCATQHRKSLLHESYQVAYIWWYRHIGNPTPLSSQNLRFLYYGCNRWVEPIQHSAGISLLLASCTRALIQL